MFYVNIPYIKTEADSNRSGFFFDYFLEDTSSTTPPTPITAIPTNGDHLRWCRLFAVISTFPISTIFSLVKKVKAVTTVNIKPIIIITIPAVFICFQYMMSPL